MPVTMQFLANRKANKILKELDFSLVNKDKIVKKQLKNQKKQKPKPKTVVYRKYKNFSNERFHLDFLSETEKYLDCSCNGFSFAFTSVLDKHASLKKDI